MLKVNLKKEEFDALAEGVREHYKEVNGEYTLDTEGGEDTSALKTAVESAKRERDEHAKNAKDAKAELEKLKKQLEESTKSKGTEMEQMTAKLEALSASLLEQTNKVKAAEASALRNKICEAAGLPKEFAERLRGETEEELTADATALKALVPEKSAEGIGGGANPPQPSKGVLESYEAGKKLAEAFNKRQVR